MKLLIPKDKKIKSTCLVSKLPQNITTITIHAHGGNSSHFSSSEFITTVYTFKHNYLKQEAKLDTILYKALFGWGLTALRVGTDHIKALVIMVTLRSRIIPMMGNCCRG